MGQRGPLPAPDNVRQLRNTTTRDPVPNVKLPPGIPQMPEWVSGEAQREWERVVPRLDREGLLATVDTAVLTAYCETWAAYVRVMGDLRRASLINPAKVSSRVHNVRSLTHTLVELAKELGCTPNARLRMPARKDDDDDDAEGVLD